MEKQSLIPDEKKPIWRKIIQFLIDLLTLIIPKSK